MKRFLSVVLPMLILTSCAFAQGTVIQESFYSEALQESRDIQVYLPEGYDPGQEYPVVYYLHGAFNGPYDIPYVPAILDDLIGNPDPGEAIRPLIFVRPDGNAGQWGGSAWVNSGLYGNYEDYIVEDLPAYIEETYTGASSDPAYRAIMGHSMGGQGAMHAALKNHAFYRAVASHSGVLDYSSFELWVPWANAEAGAGPPYVFNPSNGLITTVLFLYSGAHSWNLLNPPHFVDFLLNSQGIIDSEVMNRWLEYDPATLAGSVPAETNLRIYFNCGTNDEFLFDDFNQAFSEALDLAGLSYQYETFVGGHTSHLVQQTRDGLQFLEEAFGTTSGVETDRTPVLSARLDQNHPNPFNPQTTIAFELPKRESVNLQIFDMAGRLVRRLITAEPHTPGRHEVVWNGRDDSGRQVASGTYFYRLEAGSYSETKRMVLIK